MNLVLQRTVREHPSVLPGPYTMAVDGAIIKLAVETYSSELTKQAETQKLTGSPKEIIDAVIQECRNVSLFLQSYEEKKS